jgi:hypothetical protein
MEAVEQLFTAWMTSTTDGRDHAVTDEEFTEHRPEPGAVCGAVLYLAPMEQAPGPRCPRCVAFLEARATLRPLDQRLGVHRHRRAGWLYRLVHATMSPVVPGQRAGARHGQPEPPAEMRPNSVSAGPEHPVAVRSRLAAAGPEPLRHDEVASRRHGGTAPAGMRRNQVPAGAQTPVETGPGSSTGTASAAVYRPVAAAEALSPAGSPEKEPADSTSTTAASLHTPVAVVAGSTAVSGRAAALPSSPPCGRQGTQSPADAACSATAASAGHHAPNRGVVR